MRWRLRALLSVVLVIGLAEPGWGAADPTPVQRVKRLVPVSAENAWKPTLYALLIGVSRDQAKGYEFAYPAQDALALAEALNAQKGKLYGDVVVKVLTDQEATTRAVKRGLGWLRKATKARDLAMVFAAGRGAADPQGRFWLPSYDMDPGNMSATGVSGRDISDALAATAGKKLLFLDVSLANGTTKGGGHDGERIDMGMAVNDLVESRSGAVVFSAATGKEPSFEDPQWGHGAFAKALIEGLGGQADLLHKGMITTATLDLFIETRVKELTGGSQHPVMARPETVPDFPVSIRQ